MSDKEDINIIKSIISSATKQIGIILVAGVLSAFTINLVFIFSINNTIEVLRSINIEQNKKIEKLEGFILDLYKK